MADALADAPPHAREWVRQLIHNWHRHPTLLDPRSIINWDPTGPLRKRPSFQVYMGKEYSGFEVDDQGNLILDLTPRYFHPELVEVSMSLDRSEALSYAKSQVGGGVAPGTPLLFTFDGDALLAAQNLSLDDVIGASFDREVIPESQTVGALTLSPPKAPFSEQSIKIDNDQFGLRQFVLTRRRDENLGVFAGARRPQDFRNDYAARFAATFSLPRGEQIEAIRRTLEEYWENVLEPLFSQTGDPALFDQVVRLLNGIAPDASDEVLLKGLTTQAEMFSDSIAFVHPFNSEQIALEMEQYVDNLSDGIRDLPYMLDQLPENVRTRVLDFVRFSQEGIAGRAQIVVPRGAWSAEIPDTVSFEVDTVTDLASRILAASETPSYSPFYESLDDALQAMRFKAGEAMTDPRHASALQLSPRWHTMPESTPVYVVDTRTVSDLAPSSPTSEFTNANFNPDAVIFSRYGLAGEVQHHDVPSSMIVDGELLDDRDWPSATVDVPDFIIAAIKQQQPIIVSSEEAATQIADAIGDYLTTTTGGTYGKLSRRPAIGKAYFPVEQNEMLPGFARYPMSYTVKGKTESAALYGWSGDAQVRQNYEEFPLVWDWVDSLKQEVGPTDMVNAMMDHIISNVRAGRRLVRAVRDTDNVPTLYRNVMGERVELMPGEIISGDDLIYKSPKMDEDSLVQFSDQRYFEDQPLTYEGSSELLWPVMGPILADHAEQGMGWGLYDLKNPIEIAPIGSRRKETIYTTRTRVRSASQKHAAMTNAGDLPDWEIVQRYRPVTQNRWEQVVNYGFNNIVSPVIDAITRKPMAFHAFVIAAQRNRALTEWAIRGSVQERALRNTILSFNQRLPETQLTESAAELWAEFGRIVGTVHGDKMAAQWDNISAIGYLRGFDGDEFDELFPQVAYWYANQPQDPRLPGILSFATANKSQLQLINLGDNTNDFLTHIDRIFGEGSALEGRPMMLDAPEAEKTLAALTNDDWAAIKASAKQREQHNTQLMDYAAEHAVRDVMPFVDSHEIRSQFAEYGRGLMPFWYAEENFLKRWGKIFSQGGPAVTLERIRKLQLTYMGLKTVGIVRTDAQGRDYFVYPGSELLSTAIEKALPGQMVPISALIQTPTERIIPGFTRDFGRPSLSPFVAVSMDVVTILFPEAKPIEEALVGREYASNAIVESIVPRHVANVWNAVGTYFDSDLDPSNQRVASAMNAAIAHLDATDQGLPDDATPGQRDDYLRKVRDHARIIVFSQALAGWFTPGPAQLLQIPEGGSLDWITNGQVTNPAELLSASYYELISELGIEAGTQRYLELYPESRLKSILNPLAYTVSTTTTPSGAPLPTTDAGIEFYLDNKKILDQYPDAGPWLLPQQSDSDDTRSQYAYDTEMVNNLRERRAPTEFLTMVKYKEGANYYFNAQAVYERSYQTLRSTGRIEEARALNRAWLAWADSFRATHPLFDQMLTSDDARQRRRRVLDQMRVVLKDPLAPKAAHFDAMRILQDTFDVYQILRGELGLDRTTSGEFKLSALKVQFRAWVDDFLINNPMVMPYWTTVLQPEAGLE